MEPTKEFLSERSFLAVMFGPHGGARYCPCSGISCTPRAAERGAAGRNFFSRQWASGFLYSATDRWGSRLGSPRGKTVSRCGAGPAII